MLFALNYIFLYILPFAFKKKTLIRYLYIYIYTLTIYLKRYTFFNFTIGNIDISKNQHIENTSSTATATTNTNFATSSTGTSQLTGDFTNPFIHIIQDPYPPLNNSPILDSINGNGCFEDIYQASTINQTQTNSTTNANNFNRFDQFIKRFDEQEMLCKHEDSDQDGILFK